jgi:hypothetical protein
MAGPAATGSVMAHSEKPIRSLAAECQRFLCGCEHSRLLESEEAPDFHDCAGSRRLTAEIAERAICSHGNPPADGPDLVTVEAVYGEPAG